MSVPLDLCALHVVIWRKRMKALKALKILVQQMRAYELCLISSEKHPVFTLMHSHRCPKTVHLTNHWDQDLKYLYEQAVLSQKASFWLRAYLSNSIRTVTPTKIWHSFCEEVRVIWLLLLLLRFPLVVFQEKLAHRHFQLVALASLILLLVSKLHHQTCWEFFHL